MRIRVCRTLAAWLLLVAPSCAPQLSTGAPCVLSSECPEPYACLAGRCREECATSRDCYPFACVDVGGGLNACRVVQDEGCGGCTLPLTCVASACVAACTGPDACVAGDECREGVCVPSDAPPIGGCSPLASVSGCPEGQVCTRSGDTFACAAPPPRPSDIGEACASDVVCGSGAGCVSGRCARLCVRDTTSCGPGSLCTADPTLFGPLTMGAAPGPAPPMGLGYCTEVCDLLAPSADDGCLSGNVCAFGATAGARFFTYCRDLREPELALYEDCAAPVSLGEVRCPAGTGCAITPMSSMRVCRPFCNPDAPLPCADGSTCHVVSLPNRRVGVCGGPA